MSASPTQGESALASQLLNAEQLPGLNAGWTWAEDATGPEKPDGFGVCQQLSMADLGAQESTLRTFRSGEGLEGADAAQAVATFVDAKSVGMARQVVISSHDSCRKSLPRGMKDAGIGKVIPVAVPGAEAAWYLVTTPAGHGHSGHFDAFGMVAKGNTMTLLQISNDGMDYNYDAGKEPMALAVRAAAAELK